MRRFKLKRETAEYKESEHGFPAYSFRALYGNPIGVLIKRGITQN